MQPPWVPGKDSASGTERRFSVIRTSGLTVDRLVRLDYIRRRKSIPGPGTREARPSSGATTAPFDARRRRIAVHSGPAIGQRISARDGINGCTPLREGWAAFGEALLGRPPPSQPDVIHHYHAPPVLSWRGYQMALAAPDERPYLRRLDHPLMAEDQRYALRNEPCLLYTPTGCSDGPHNTAHRPGGTISTPAWRAHHCVRCAVRISSYQFNGVEATPARLALRPLFLVDIPASSAVAGQAGGRTRQRHSAKPTPGRDKPPDTGIRQPRTKSPN